MRIKKTSMAGAAALAMIAPVAVWGQTMVAGYSGLRLNTMKGDIVMATRHTGSSTAGLRISTRWANAESGTLKINGDKVETLGGDSELVHQLWLPANVCETYICEWESEGEVIARTIRTIGDKKLGKAETRLDTREVKSARSGVAEIVYDSRWTEDGAGAEVFANGRQIAEGPGGTYDWDMACSRTNEMELAIRSSAGETLETFKALLANGEEDIAGHSPVVSKSGVAATSGRNGLTEEIACAVCGEVIQNQTDIPALGYLRDVQARQLWPHGKVEVTYEIADDIREVAGGDEPLHLSVEVADDPGEPEDYGTGGGMAGNHNNWTGNWGPEGDIERGVEPALAVVSLEGFRGICAGDMSGIMPAGTGEHRIRNRR